MQLAAIALFGLLAQEKTLFEESFAGKLSDGWTWVREDPQGWKIEGGALSIKAEPGKIWYKTKTAKNLLLRKCPAVGLPGAPVSFEVTVEAAPEANSEQCGLYFYQDEKNFVKIIRERLKGSTRVLLVREQKGIPEPQPGHEEAAPSVRLRLSWSGDKVSGAYKARAGWISVGEVETPFAAAGASVALASHGAGPEADRWTKFSNFLILGSSK